MNTAAERRVTDWLTRSAVLVCLLVTPSVLLGQSRADTGRHTLTVRPHAGDTLWLHLEQTMESRVAPISAGARSGATRPATGAAMGKRSPAAPAPDYGPVQDRSSTQSTYMKLRAHSTVESSDARMTTLAIVTDSLSVRVGSGSQSGALRPVALKPGSMRTRVNVTSDGSMTVLNAASSSTLTGLTGMPPMLPSGAVAVGDRWERDVPLPSLPLTGVRTDGVVRAQFRFDSLSKSGRHAYISLTGTLRRDGAARDFPAGTQVITAGTLRGVLVLDRTRGWITEAETAIDVLSEVIPRVGDSAKPRALEIRLQQRMRVR
ncbi:MAG: hypothetical protein ACO1Q7_13195 [Gemmatimonas sp.]